MRQTDRSVLNLVHVQNVNIRTCHFENTCYPNVIAKIAWSMKADKSLRLLRTSVQDEIVSSNRKNWDQQVLAAKRRDRADITQFQAALKIRSSSFFLRGQLYPWYGGYSEYSLIMRLQVQHEVKGSERWRTTWGRRRTWRSTWRTFT